MGINNCPLCEVNGDTDSPELIDHVLEHVHDFSLRSLPWPKSSEVDLGDEVGSFDSKGEAADTVTQWLEGYEHETEDIDPTLKLSSCDYGRLAIISEQMQSGDRDKIGLDICFADEHGDESAEAETDISELTQDSLGLMKDASEASEADEGDAQEHQDETQLKKKADRQSSTGFRKLADRIFSRNKSNDLRAHNDFKVVKIFNQFPALSQQAYNVLAKLYQRRLDPIIKRKSVFSDFIRDVQFEEISPTDPPVSDLDSFLHVMVASHLRAVKPLPPKDLSKTISDYFINTSHQPVLYKTPPVSRISLDSFRDALFAGYRSIDIKVWDGGDDPVDDIRGLDPDVLYQPPKSRTGLTTRLNRLSPKAEYNPTSESPKITLSKPEKPSSRIEPIVTDAYNLSMRFRFRDVCVVIRESAFLKNDLPLIINLAVYASPDEQQMMVHIMKEEWHGLLLEERLDGYAWFELPRLEDLRNRILVNSSGVNLSQPEDFRKAFPSATDQEQSDIILQYGYNEVTLIQSLANLTIYFRSQPFKGFGSFQAKIPAHDFSLRENKLKETAIEEPTRKYPAN
ncbi:hypothetical protein IL306_009815 [Fusarium sp. DS 682]|nr:hypothetical protein IL306_009815 [Fusarium sp. DS 682]